MVKSEKDRTVKSDKDRTVYQKREIPNLGASRLGKISTEFREVLNFTDNSLTIFLERISPGDSKISTFSY
jgi:hypothetical protein